MTGEPRALSDRRRVIGAVLITGSVAGLIGFGQFDGGQKAKKGRSDPTALEQIRTN
jgi:hypothetical protein